LAYHLVLAVVGNKIDRTEEEAISYNEVKLYAESIGAMFRLTSAKDGKGINVPLHSPRNSSPLWPKNMNSFETDPPPPTSRQAVAS
jgi:hypothetical protein